MGYFDYFRALLQPLGVYELAEGSYSGAELAALGSAMDALAAQVADGLREMLPVTAEDAGLAKYEELLPWRPAAASVQARRDAILALLRMGGASLDAVRQSLAGCGAAATVTPTEEPGLVAVSFPGCYGYPPDLARVRAILEALLPAHLEVRYDIVWRTWQDVAARWASWAAVGAATWEEVSTFQ